MLTLVQIRASRASSPDADSLVADYLSFDRQRTLRRQYMKAFGGMAVIVLAGALLGRVDAREAEIVATVLLSIPACLAAVEWVHWRRLMKRLARVRADVHSSGKS